MQPGKTRNSRATRDPRRLLAVVTALLPLAVWAAPRPRQPGVFTHFESFESAVENTAADPRDVNGNGVIDCGADNDCSTVTPCGLRRRLCDEWTLPLPSDENLRLVNESRPGTPLPGSRGHAEVVAVGSKSICPVDAANGLVASGVVDRLDFHVHTRLTPDIDGTDTSKPGTMSKAFRGQNSLHWGRHVRVVQETRPPRDVDPVFFGDTYALQTINAFILDRDGGLNLNTESSPEQPLQLSFWHIVEMCDHECFQFFVENTTDDMAIVEVRADQDPSAGEAWGLWERVEAQTNPYESVQDTAYTTPSYEPPDDSNPLGTTDTETTMCSPLFIWASQGSAKGLDAATCLDGDGNGFGDCGGSTGPVARGETGVGVWAQSIVDLSRYAGRRIQVRFITSAIDGDNQFLSYLEPAIVTFAPPESSSDDGWYVDDVRVSGLVATEAGR